MKTLALLSVLVSSGAPELVDVAGLEPRFVIDIRYARTDNFFGQKVYPEGRCLVLAPVAERLVQAQRWLDRHHRGLRLMFKDCYRPRHVQAVLWKAVEGTPKARYVANPNTKTGSLHAYGAAVDVTLADAGGAELDMGTPYDFLGPAAEPRHEARLLRDGVLTRSSVKARRILRAALRSAGFIGIRREWWHFNAASARYIRTHFRPLDVPFSAVPKPAGRVPASRPASAPSAGSR